VSEDQRGINDGQCNEYDRLPMLPDASTEMGMANSDPDAETGTNVMM
jgi:hypothetical protein